MFFYCSAGPLGPAELGLQAIRGSQETRATLQITVLKIDALSINTSDHFLLLLYLEPLNSANGR